MLTGRKSFLNIRFKELQLDYFIDAAFFVMLSMAFTVNDDNNYAYKVFFFVFVGLSVTKVIIRLFSDGKIKIPTVFLWYLSFTLFSLASALWAKYPQSTVASMTRMIQILSIFFCMAQNYATENGFKRCIKIFCWVSIYCTAFIFLKTPFSDWFSGRMGHSATGNNVNIIGMLLSLCLLIAIYYAYYCKKRIYYLFAIAEFVIIVLTSSRRSILAALGGIVMLIFLKDKSWRLLFRLVAIILMAAGVFYIIMNVEPLYNIIGVRFDSMLEYTQTNSGDTSMQWRDVYIDYAKRFFFEHPLLGIGTANFSPMLGDLINRYTYSHNNYFELLANNGLIGFGIYYSFYIYLVVRLVKICLASKSGIAKTMLTVMAVIIVSEFSIVIYRTVSLMAFICLAFLFICAYDNNHINYKLINKREET